MCERLGNDVSVALAEALWPGQDDQVGGGLTGHGDDVVRRHAATADQLRAVDCALADRASACTVAGLQASACLAGGDAIGRPISTADGGARSQLCHSSCLKKQWTNASAGSR